MILINGQFPGPVLEANEGDEVWVEVFNLTPFNTTMHYHGIEMSQTPWSDGVPGVSQRQILPGGSFLYKWTATQYGEYWYHAHHRGQTDDGQFGAIIIHPKNDRPTPLGLISQDRGTLRAIEKAVANVKPLILSDWRHDSSDEVWDIVMASQLELPCFDSLLINGQGKVNCWSPSKIASLLSPTQQKLLEVGGAKAMTPKAYAPLYILLHPPPSRLSQNRGSRFLQKRTNLVNSCLPKEVQAKVIAGGRPTKLSAIPPKIFDVCSPTQGSNAIIQVQEDESDRNGTWVALNVIGAYSTVTTTFSIDELPMWIYAVDGEYIEPQKVNAISVTNGDRYSFLVHLTDAGDYTIRQAATLAVQLLSGQGTLSYRRKHQPPTNQTSMPHIDDAGRPLSADVVFFDQAAQKPYPAFPVGQKADQTFILEIGNTELAYKWSLNGTSLPLTLDADDPILFKPQPNLMNNLTITTRNNTWVDLIFVATQVPQPPHPIHKHGNKMWLLGSGHGPFKWNSVEEAMKAIPQNFNLVNPPRRDGFATLDAPRDPTWMAVRYHVTNPGAWFIHCHIQSHMLGGMAMVIQDGIDHWPKVPREYLSYK
ncbi:hypothetical protein McanCB49686_008082 [Microsporum canis]